MFQSAQFELSRLEHHHGGDEWHDMHEVTEPHDPADTDPERSWSNGRIFRCNVCEDEIRVSASEGGGLERAVTG